MKNFQIILVPILLIVFVWTSLRFKGGLIAFLFSLLLINNLPYFFGIDGSVPHAPTALLLFWAFFLGWLLHRAFFDLEKLQGHALFLPLFMFSSVIIVSAFITFFRCTNFFPLAADRIYEILVNVNGVRSGGALMSVVFSSLNYLTGFLLFFILFREIKNKSFVKRIWDVLFAATFISLIFAFVQLFYSKSLGNTPFFVTLNRINSTFKDPNSFGVYLSAFIPLALGLAFALPKPKKIFPIALIILALVIFPTVGSRSGLLGLIGAVFLFCLLLLISSTASFKKKMVLVLCFCLVLIVLTFAFYMFSKHSNLYERLDLSLDFFLEDTPLNRVLTHRIDFWKVATEMIKDYPLTGVGVGYFIVDLPNYSKQMGLRFKHTDSAENYFFQVGAELGLAGLLLALWMFMLIIKGLRESWKRLKFVERDRFIIIGLISGAVSIFINYIFHTYIGSFEIKYFFWLIIALALVFPRIKQESQPAFFIHSRFKVMTLVVMVIFGAIHLWHSTRSLSLRSRSETFGLEQNFGLYALEKDDRGIYFHWTKKRAGFSLDYAGNDLRIPIKASHPDIKTSPIHVKIFMADFFFRKQSLLDEITLAENVWTNSVYRLPVSEEKKVYFIIETDRTWQPSEILGIPDTRRLAVGLGRAWFEYKDRIPEDRIQEKSTYSPEKWSGKLGSRLWANAISEMEFEVSSQTPTALRLHVKGREAFGWGPYIIVRVDEQVIARTVVSGNRWVFFDFKPALEPGTHSLSIEFINDVQNPALRQDRNLILGELEVIYLDR